MRKSFEEWVRMFEAKTGKPFKRSHVKMFYYPEKGFCEIGVDRKNNIVVLYQVCGDGMFWRRMAEVIADALGIPCCGTVALRNVKGYIRRFGYRVDRTEYTEDGMERYFCTDGYGNHGTCSPAWIDEDTGRWSYFITWEVPKSGSGF